MANSHANTMLETIRQLQNELDRIYAVTNDLSDDTLAAVSHELDALFVHYLRSQGVVSDISDAIT
ncbi:hypothetical protein CO251_10930 [Sulfobacillus sp. hq2]|uniref:Spo0E like sporulation regulatory protein n=1 Tax=Sulfobacillus thermotolerans TaxID=338644 RepID=A0ABM6RTY7_9FIRM|nr:hypothetical protein BXT84_14145 [Sulfobacillus thermotolerans]POB10446.1 hypothetical protein CO251_10930 [Sulfobacillus sp. hq2]